MHPLTVEMFLVISYVYLIAGVSAAAVGWNIPRLQEWFAKRKGSK